MAVYDSRGNRVSQDIIGGRVHKNTGFSSIGHSYDKLNSGYTVSGSGGSSGGSNRRDEEEVVPGTSLSMEGLFDKYAAMIKENTAANNAWSAEQAKINRDWQEKMLNANNAFNSQEAQKNRDWQAKQSATAHQREVKDLLAAGLNPVLSAMNGNGASTTSGATASSGSAPSGAVGQTDTSASGALVSLLGALVSSMTQQENARLSAQASLAVAEKYNAMSKYTAELQASTQLTTTNIQSAASKWIAELQAKTSISNTQAQTATSRIVANIQAAAQKYGYNVQSWTQQEVARLNNETSKELKQLGIDAEFQLQDTDLKWKGEHPSNLEQAGIWYGKDLVDALLDGAGMNSGKSFAEGARGGGFSGFR